MSVVNCKVKYIRPKYNNLREWMNDESNIYIGRKGVVFIDSKRFPQNSSNFANPYKIGKDGTCEEILLKYENYIVNKLNNDEDLVIELLSLKGKNLGCWCCPESCHLPSGERASPVGEVNEALVPVPSTLPDDPLPAIVLTSPVDRTILRRRRLLRSATNAKVEFVERVTS